MKGVSEEIRYILSLETWLNLFEFKYPKKKTSFIKPSLVYKNNKKIKIKTYWVAYVLSKRKKK